MSTGSIWLPRRRNWATTRAGARPKEGCRSLLSSRSRYVRWGRRPGKHRGRTLQLCARQRPGLAPSILRDLCFDSKTVEATDPVQDSRFSRPRVTSPVRPATIAYPPLSVRPSVTVIKTLFALSGNTCAYRGCEEALTDPKWQQVKADVAHIRGERPGAARYDPNMTDLERHDFPNLLLLCPNHHRLIDRLEPEAHPVELLLTMKQQHEARSTDSRDWASEEELLQIARLVDAEPLDSTRRSPDTDPSSRTNAPESERPRSAGRPRLVLNESPDHNLDVLNVGDGDAYAISIEVVAGDPASLVLAAIPPGRLSPGGSWRAGANAVAMGDKEQALVRLGWADNAGNRSNADFPLQ